MIREDNQAAGKSWTWTYDDAGNILTKKEYAYTTGTLGTATSTINYTYDTTWGDLLKTWNGKTISTDTIGNMTSNGTWSYTWEHGRELASMSNGSTTWSFTYDADGMHTKWIDGERLTCFFVIGRKHYAANEMSVDAFLSDSLHDMLYIK